MGGRVEIDFPLFKLWQQEKWLVMELEVEFIIMCYLHRICYALSLLLVLMRLWCDHFLPESPSPACVAVCMFVWDRTITLWSGAAGTAPLGYAPCPQSFKVSSPPHYLGWHCAMTQWKCEWKWRFISRLIQRVFAWTNRLKFKNSRLCCCTWSYTRAMSPSRLTENSLQ